MRRMHTTETKSATFIHNGDYSGKVTIVGSNGDRLEVEPAEAVAGDGGLGLARKGGHCPSASSRALAAS